MYDCAAAVFFCLGAHFEGSLRSRKGIGEKEREYIARFGFDKVYVRV